MATSKSELEFRLILAFEFQVVTEQDNKRKDITT